MQLVSRWRIAVQNSWNRWIAVQNQSFRIVQKRGLKQRKLAARHQSTRMQKDKEEKIYTSSIRRRCDQSAGEGRLGLLAAAPSHQTCETAVSDLTYSRGGEAYTRIGDWETPPRMPRDEAASFHAGAGRRDMPRAARLGWISAGGRWRWGLCLLFLGFDVNIWHWERKI
jgi:hypothetical protein